MLDGMNNVTVHVVILSFKVEGVSFGIFEVGNGKDQTKTLKYSNEMKNEFGK